MLQGINISKPEWEALRSLEILRILIPKIFKVGLRESSGAKQTLKATD